ncbi:MAG: lactonase family protein [Oscillospiraceae bacterium]|jgi:6-phosphogluconolactonase|nr:lactonase family protein [Oscillospiraceae bacterium]
MRSNYYAYIGTYTGAGSKGIYHVEVDGTGKARIVGTYEARDPSYLAVRGERLVAVYESPPSKGGARVALYSIEQDGGLVKQSERSGGGVATCYAALDDDNVYTANYGSGEAGIYRLTEGGGLGEGQWIAHYGESVNKARQESSHAHCAVPVGLEWSGGGYLAVCDLGTDKVWFYPRKDGKVSLPGVAVSTPAGTGPRHMAEINDKAWAVIGEMSCEVLVYEGYGKDAVLAQRVMFARKAGEIKNTASALKVSKDKTMALGAVRGEQSVALAKIKGGRLEQAEIVDAKGDWPRDAAFTPDGRFVVVACEHSNELTIFQVKDSGLAFVSRLGVPSPTCVCFVP